VSRSSAGTRGRMEEDKVPRDRFELGPLFYI
jgi:hypothetical protein